MSNPKIQDSLNVISSTQEESFNKDPECTFSEDEIRTRAYQIYESRDRNGNHAGEEWVQAQTELTEMLGGK